MINHISKDIIKLFGVNKFIETGAFMGDSLVIVQDWFIELFGQEFNTGPWKQGNRGRQRIYEVEVKKEYLDQYIIPRWQEQTNVEIAHGDSVAWLRDKIDEGEFTEDDRCFFYLDAHSHGSPNPEPLRDEIRLISQLKQPIISCDDWNVPHGNHDIYATSQIQDLIKDRTDTVWYSKYHNYHGKWSVFIFLDRNYNDVNAMVHDLPLIGEAL